MFPLNMPKQIKEEKTRMDEACIIETLLKFHQHLHPLCKVENSFDYRMPKLKNSCHGVSILTFVHAIFS
jgi:hypothetical protein